MPEVDSPGCDWGGFLAAVGVWHPYCGDPPFFLAPTWPSDVEAIAKLITTFLELHRLESPGELSQSSDSEADGPRSQS